MPSDHQGARPAVANSAQRIAARRIDDIDWENWRPRDPASLVFVRQEDRLLLIRKKRGLGAGKINAAGGRREGDESPLSCGLREIAEELRIAPKTAELAGENRYQFTDGYSMHVHVFVARSFSGVPSETAEAIPLWVAIDAIPYPEMWQDDVHWIPMLLAGERFDGRYIFDGDRMLDWRVERVG